MGEASGAALLGLLIPLFIVPLAFLSRSAARAVLLGHFASLLFGPEGAWIKLPSFPALDKLSIPLLVILVTALLLHGKRIARSGIFTRADFPVALGFVGAIATSLTNTDPLVYGSWVQVVLPGMNIVDGVHNAILEMSRVGLAFLIGRWLFRTPQDLTTLLTFMVAAGIVQVPLMLIEIRMSPILHQFVYGYSHADFRQVMRGGGFRPMNFMAHGLALAIFVFAAMFCAFLLARSGRSRVWGLPIAAAAAILATALALSKSAGAIVWGIAAALLLWRSRARTLHGMAAALAVIAFCYPLLRSLGAVPVETMLDMASVVSVERAESLKVRLDNEQVLLDKARERIVFGWGTYGRPSIWDPDMGTERAIMDGHWIICLGVGGLFRFAEAFGLILLPVLAARRSQRLIRQRHIRLRFAGLSLLVAILAAELIPNGLYSNYVYVMAGALAGMTQEMRRYPMAWRPSPSPPNG